MIDQEAAKAELGMCLAQNLADAVTARFLAQGYHWNVMGQDFNEFHEFFGNIYESYDAAIDPLAEYILKNGYDAPYMLTDFLEMTCIKEERISNGDARAMLGSLLKVNESLKVGAIKLFNVASVLNAQDIANYAAELLETYNKWNWQIRATLGTR